MPKFSPARAAKKRAQFSAIGTAIKNKIGEVGQKLTDPFAAKMTVDNAKNPASAYSMMMRKTKSMGQPKNFPQ